MASSINTAMDICQQYLKVNNTMVSLHGNIHVLRKRSQVTLMLAYTRILFFSAVYISCKQVNSYMY